MARFCWSENLGETGTTAERARFFLGRELCFDHLLSLPRPPNRRRIATVFMGLQTTQPSPLVAVWTGRHPVAEAATSDS
jgi:hypothetical protein